MFVRGPKDTEVDAGHENKSAIGISVESEIWDRLGYYFVDRPNGPKVVGR
jgi:hypothetical protein